MKLLFLATFALFVLSAFDQADASAYDKIVAHSRIRAKKEGWGHFLYNALLLELLLFVLFVIIFVDLLV